MPVTLRVIDDAGVPTGAAFDFDTHDTFIFGRDLKAHCRITDDPGVSRHHFVLEVIPPRARLKDLGSTNGVRVNGVLYGGRNGRRTHDGQPAPVDLKNGDRIRVGKTGMEFLVHPPADDANEADADDAGDERPTINVIADGPIAASPAAAHAGDDEFGALETFCDRCGKMIGGTSIARVGEQTLCMACRFAVEEESGAVAPSATVDRGPAKPAGGRFAELLRAQSAADDGPPKIRGYRVERLLGRGGMGAVYLAERLADSQLVAVKVVLPGMAIREATLAQFRREIAVIRQLVHDNIVAFVDEGSAGASLYLAMEYVPDGSIATRIRKNGAIPPKHALRWMRQMVDAMATAHSLDLIHRDIKPANMLLAGKDFNADVKLSDFGLAKSFGAAGVSCFTATGTAAGTATCMPPEQLSNFKRVNKTADVFSLGATFYEMLTGRSPYNFKPGKDPMTAVLAFDLVPLARRDPGLPAKYIELVDRCLSAGPEDRYGDAAELGRALDRL